jgi:hypothetical protein
MERQLDELKERLLKPIIETVTNNALASDLRRAATEAAALAWYSACPFLLLPTLLEEKVRATFRRWEKQQQIRSQTPCKPEGGARRAPPQ